MKYIYFFNHNQGAAKSLRYLPYFFIMALFLLGCKPIDEEGQTPTDPPVQIETVDLTFKFSALTGPEFISAANDTIKIAKLKFLFSYFLLEKSNGDLVKVPDAYGFVSLTEGIDSFVIKNVPKGDYKSLWLEVGVDSVANHANPQQWPLNHPLNPSVNDMHWGWAGGYIFNVIEGYYKNNGFNKAFSFHVALDKNARMYNYITNYNISKNSKFTMFVNVEKYFSNVINFSLKNDGDFSHSGDPDLVMDKFIKNVGVISFVDFK